MISVIENDELIVKINTLGAQLWSIKDKSTNFEYIWQGDEAVWERRAPILFPQCGNYPDGYNYNGEQYHLVQHGFGRDQVFDEVEKGIFRIVSNESTLKNYPFNFTLDVTYKLEGRVLKQGAILKNTGNEILPYSFGFHNGYNITDTTNLIIDDKIIKLDSEYLSSLKTYNSKDINCFGLSDLFEINQSGASTLIVWSHEKGNDLFVCLESRTDFGEKEHSFPFASKLGVSETFMLEDTIKFL